MPAKLPAHIAEALEAEKVGLQARIDANEPDDPRLPGWVERIKLIDAELKPKRGSKKETRPAEGASESRPG